MKSSSENRFGPEPITLSCVGCGAGGSLEWDYDMGKPYIKAYRCQVCSTEQVAKHNRMIEAGVFERINQLITGISEVQDMVRDL